MNKPHTIDEVVFDISFDSTEIAREQEFELGAFIRNRLLPLADEIFCELSPEGMVSRIDLLEIDLGDMNYSGFREEMESRFREQFRAVLLDKIRSVMKSPSSVEGVFSKQKVERSQLEHFLETGRMAWEANQGGVAAGDEMLQRAIRDGGKTFVEFLKNTPQRDIVVKRLVKQFSEPLMLEIMQLLAPAHASFLGSLIGKLGSTWEKNLNGVSEKEFKILILEQLINDLLKSGNSVDDPESLFRETTETVLAQYAKAEKVSATQLPEENEEGESTVRLLAARLEAAMVEGKAGALRGAWDEIHQNHADLVRGIFTRRMGDENLRKKLAEGFSETMLHDLISILAPMESSFLAALAKQSEFQTRTAGASRANSNLMLTHALGYLHAAQGKSVDRSDYARSLVSYLAGHGIAQTETLLALSRTDPVLGKELSGQPYQETLVGEAGRIVRPDTATTGITRAEALRQRLARRLSYPPHEEEMAQEIEELASTYPETLARLYRQLQSSDIRANLSGLTAREARQLTTSLIGLTQGSAVSDFQRSIEEHANKAQNEQRYYQSILEKLIHNQSVDLEAAAQALEGIKPSEESRQDAAPPSSQSVAETKFVSQQNTHESDAPENRETELVYDKLLRTRLEEALALGRIEGIVDVWDDLCRNYADMVQETFMRRLGDEIALDKLARGFPEAMLHDMIRLFVPGESKFIATLCEQPELRTDIAETTHAVNAMLWKYTLAYLHAVRLIGYERLAYASGLIRHLAGQGLPSARIQQAIVRADPSIAMSLESLNLEIISDNVAEKQESRPAASDEHAVVLYRQLLLRLSGQDRDRELVQELVDLANDAPETLKKLYRQLQDGDVDVDVTALSAREARQHIEAFIIHMHGSIGIEFQRAIEEHANQAQSEQRYYQSILEKLIHNQIVDLEAAMGEVPQEVKAVSPPGTEEVGLAETELLRTRLESALAQGNAGELSGIWDDLRLNHADLVREVFTRRMGDASLRRKLVQGFPEALLLDLIRLLNPQESSFIETLAKQTELQAGRADDIKNTLWQALWEHTLAYLHTLGTRSFSRAAYARGLISRMVEQGVDTAILLQAITRVDAALVNALAETAPLSETIETPKRQAEPTRADELYEQLKHHLSGADRQAGATNEHGKHDDETRHARFPLTSPLPRIPSPQFSPASGRGSEREKQLLIPAGEGDKVSLREFHNIDLAQEIEELASTYPEVLARLYRQLQAGEIQAKVDGLSAREARQLSLSFIGLNRGSAASDFQRAIEEHANKAQSEQRYYQRILEKLIHNQIVDLEAAMGEAPQEVKAASPVGTDEVGLAEPELLRTRLESALAQGNAGELSGIWDDLRLNHADMLREVFTRRMGDENARNKLVEGFPEGMLQDLIRILAPRESSFMEALAKQPELRTRNAGATRATSPFMWKHTLGYLHTAGGVDRSDYISSLVTYLTGAGMVQADILSAITRIDPASGKKLLSQLRQDNIADETGQKEIVRPHTAEKVIQRAEQLYQRLVRRLNDVNAEGEIAREIEELASKHPETLARLYRQLQAGEIQANVAGLDLSEARILTTSFVGLNQGSAVTDFQRAIEDHANKAQNEQRYYQHILEKLIHNQTVDLEVAMAEVLQTSGQEASVSINTQVEKSSQTHKVMVQDAVKANQPPLTTKAKPEPTHASDKDSTPYIFKRDEIEETTEDIYIANAGLVLVSPYLPQLFRMLDLTDGTKFKDERAAERAIHLLQFTVNESCDSPEFLLALNKILCGFVTGVPIIRGIELLAKEKETVEGMLTAIIKTWTIIGNTSVQGLRESFLQRGGRLQLKGGNWHLKVEQKGIDVLIDRIPWSFSIIKHPWMERPIYVEWRK